MSHNNISQIHRLQFRNLIKLTEIHLDHNMISDIHPLQFQNLTNLTFLYLDHNKISEIHPLQFQNLTELTALHLENNMISKIHPLQFQNLTNLASLYLDHNMIYKIHPLQFQNLTKLITLYLDHNRISEIHQLQFQNLSRLRDLHLNNNEISKIHTYQFHDMKDAVLMEIFLHHNNISEIPTHVFPYGVAGMFVHLYLGHNRISKIHQSTVNPLIHYGLKLEYNRLSVIQPMLLRNFTRLQWLYLDHNEITYIHPRAFQPMQQTLLILSDNNLVAFTFASDVHFKTLHHLNLANNKLRVLSYTIFHSALILTFLDVSSNHINMISSMILANTSIYTVKNLKLINLRHNNLYSLNTATFRWLNKSTTVLVENEAACCFIPTVNCSATIPRSQFLTCGRLLPNQIQRVTMWILGLFAIMSNLGVLFFRYRNKERENKVQLLLISNLSISDAIMGVYMIMISSADLYYRQTFPSEFWRASFTCKFAGTLSVFI